MFDLTGRRAVVTGASSGIGRATAISLATRGAEVWALARHPESLDMPLNYKGSIHPVIADVTDLGSLERAASEVGSCDLLVAAAGVLNAGRPAERGTWEQVLAVNVVGLFRTIDVFGPALADAGRTMDRSDLVIISSNAANEETPRRSSYHASKAAASKLGAIARQDYHEWPVRVTTIEPGATHTAIAEQPSLDSDRQLMTDFFTRVDALRAEDVAATILFAVSLRRGVNISRMTVLPLLQGANGRPVGH